VKDTALIAEGINVSASKLWKNFRCPTCNAAVGKLCIAPCNGFPAYKPHISRKRLSGEAPPRGFAFATSSELAKELGATPEEATAFENRISSLCGDKPKLV
jgi:hypothetical protein